MSSREYAVELSNRFFEGQLPSAFLDELAKLPIDRADVKAFVERAFSLMTELLQRAKNGYCEGIGQTASLPGGSHASDCSLSDGG